MYVETEKSVKEIGQREREHSTSPPPLLLLLLILVLFPSSSISIFLSFFNYLVH
jgi:hypothetical protein